MNYDAAGAIKSLMEDNWDDSNTDEKTPTFSKVYDVKVISLAVKDGLFVYNTPGAKKEFNGVGSRNFRGSFPVTIDLRSAYHPNKDTTKDAMSTVTAHEHITKLMIEVERIIKLKASEPGNGFEVIMPITDKDLSDRRKKLFRWVYEVMLKVSNY